MKSIRKDYDGEYQIALLLVAQQDAHWFHLLARPVKHYITGALRGRIRGVGTYEEVALDDLQISCQGDNDRRERGVYAWEVEYHQPYTVRLPRARAMATLLQQVERRLKAMTDLSGPPQSYGQYVNRVGSALDAHHVLQARRESSASSSYDDHDYREWTLGDAVVQVDWLIRQWQEQGQEQAAKNIA